MSEGNYNVDNIPTYVALPVDAFDNNSLQKPEQFRIIKNAIIKTLSDGSLCIIDTNDVFFLICMHKCIIYFVVILVWPKLASAASANQSCSSEHTATKCPHRETPKHVKCDRK